MARDLDLKEHDRIFTPDDLYLEAKRRPNFYGKFSMSHHKIEQLLVDQAPETVTTLLAIRWRVRVQNLATFRHVDLAERLNVSQLTISRHLKKLRALGLLVPDEDDKESAAPRSWRVHPLLAWKGTGAEKDSYWQSLPFDHPFKKSYGEEQ